VSRVLFPALESDPGHALWKRDFDGAASLFGVVLKPATDESVVAMIDSLQLFGIGSSWGGYESLAIRAKMITRTATPWNPEGPKVRIHVGLEHPQDLIDDLARGLDRLSMQ
jgi:cystathionine beta-lyase